MSTPLRGPRERFRPAREAVFVVVFVVVSFVIAYWTHQRDTSHGDRWDWSDWLEVTLAAMAAGFLITGGLRRLAHRVGL